MRQYDVPDSANNTEPISESSYTWFDAVLLLIKTPNIESFIAILKDSKMTATRAYAWVLFGGIFLGVSMAAVYPPSELIGNIMFGLPSEILSDIVYQPTIYTMAISGSIVGSIYTIIGFIIQTFVYHRIGLLFRVSSKFRDLVTLRGVYFPIILVMRSIAIPLLGHNSLPTTIFMYATILLDIFLASLALRACYRVLQAQQAQATEGA